MTVQTWETRRRTGRRRGVLTALLALVMLVPLGMLYLEQNRHQGERRSAATQERRGIEYLLALGPLTITLNEARSAAVSGAPVPRDLLDEALAVVADVDDELGEELQVGERWSQLRETIERAAGTDHADERAAHAAYGEAGGLLLDLHARLRENSGLVRDPDQDAHHLQSAAGQALPETIVATGHLVDLIAITADEPAGDRDANAAEVSGAVTTVRGPVDELVVSVQAALDTTGSRSLSSTVLTKYDRFLRAKDALLVSVSPEDGEVEDIDPGPLGGIQTELQAAAADLYTTLLTELDTLIEDRAGDLGRGQRTAVAAVVVGALLAFGLAALGLVREVRRPRPAQPPLGSAGERRGLGSGPGERGSPELPSTRVPASDTAGGYEPESGAPPGGERVAGELLASERANVR